MDLIEKFSYYTTRGINLCIVKCDRTSNDDYHAALWVVM